MATKKAKEMTQAVEKTLKATNKQAMNKTEEQKFAWFDMTSVQDKLFDDILHTVSTHGFSGILVTAEQAKTLPTSLKKIGLFRKNHSLEDVVNQYDLYDLLLLEDDLFDLYIEQPKNRRDKINVFVHVTDHDSLQRACSYLSKCNYVVVDFKDETKIPLELVLAEAESHSAQVVTRVHDSEEAEVVVGVLEKGSHGVLIGTSNVEQLIQVGYVIHKKFQTVKLDLAVLTIDKIEHVGMGERACIDTCAYLGLDEGALVGSFSNGGILACSETHPLPYMPTRPFRINAGSIHSYVLAPNNRTWYLSDLRAGMEILAVRTDGTARRVTVGRIKIEKRPLLSITVVSDTGEKINVIMQDDWHVRVFGAEGGPRNITTLKPGDKVLGYLPTPGRHVGIQVEEFILEQ